MASTLASPALVPVVLVALSGVYAVLALLMVQVALGGEIEENASANGAIVQLLPACVVAMFLLFVWQFESVRKSLIVLASIPFVSIGAALALIATGTTLTFVGTLGLLALAGIIVNNAVLLLGRIAEDREAGMAFLPAVAHAAEMRLRPIVMTKMVCILGLVPLPFHSVHQGVLWLPDEAIVRAEVPGHIRQVLQPAGRFRLPEEALAGVGELAAFELAAQRQCLDRHQAADLGVAAKVDRAHRASADRPVDAVPAEAGALQVGHRQSRRSSHRCGRGGQRPTHHRGGATGGRRRGPRAAWIRCAHTPPAARCAVPVRRRAATRHGRSTAGRRA